MPTLYVHVMMHKPELLGRSVMHVYAFTLATESYIYTLYIIHVPISYECARTAEWHAVFVQSRVRLCERAGAAMRSVWPATYTSQAAIQDPTLPNVPLMNSLQEKKGSCIPG